MRNRTRQTWLPCWLLAGLLTTACGQTATTATQDGPDVVFQLDIQAALDALGKDSAVPEILHDQTSAADGSDGAGGNCEFPAAPQPGEAGAACSTSSDCNSGFCVDAANGKICSAACFDCCPSGFACKAYAGNSATMVCQAVGLNLCWPCTADADCAKSGSGALCVHYGTSGSFCGSACASDGDCRGGYQCAMATGENGTAKQCILLNDGKKSVECPCSAAAIAAGASTVCQVANSAGTCAGVRSCGAAGLSVCPAATPTPEVCGDGQDNNCNGQTDEAGAPGCTPFYSDGDKDGDGKAGSAAQCLCAANGSYTAATATDCDDSNPAINGKASEVCDGVDNNCDGQTDEGCDSDGDGYCNAAKTLIGTPAICPKGGGDCNDNDAAIHPEQQEICGNFKDDDCDGLTDSGPNVSACVPFFQDGDGDGYGVGVPVCQCGVKPGYTAVKSGDCNDGDDSIHPAAIEVCNGVDDNCDGATDEAGASGCTPFYADGDGDGYGVGASVCLCAASKAFSASKGGDCDDTAAAISPAAAESCNGVDDNCDGVTDGAGAQGCTTYFADSDGDGFGASGSGVCLCAASTATSSTLDTDCDDSNASVHPGAAEICDGLDNNCDGVTDGANTADCKDFYVDGDGDGWGSAAEFACQCAADATFSASKAGDCQDGNAAVNPGATEVCDGVDNNCVNGVDEAGATGCTVYARDHDGDGYGAIGDTKCLCAKTGEYTAILATDCNDNDKNVHPKALETCDGVDNDCDGLTDPAGSDNCNNWFVDQDGDGYGTYALPSKCLCAGGPGLSSIGGDCDDGNAAINPDATEVCNGKDDNCDGIIDPANTSGCTIYYADGDGDGYGLTNVVQCTCSASGAFTATQGGDCNDSSAAINPGAVEICNGLDDNCNGQTDEGITKAWYVDADKDGYGTGVAQFACAAIGAYTATQAGDCDDSNPTTYPGAPELCNGVDDNCNGQTDEGGSSSKFYLDADGDGFGTGGGMILCGTSGGYTATVGGDCDDSNAAIHPGAVEVCNGVDDDCNGQIDDGLPTGDYYKDGDGDGYGAGALIVACSGAGYVTLNGDCNDASAAIHPGASEVCNGADDNCNGQTDEGLATSTYFPDADKDGYGTGAGVSACGPLGANTAIVGGDCDDGNANINPAKAEVCGNGVDDNCNGQVDEGCVACAPTMLEDFETTNLPAWLFSAGSGSLAKYWNQVTGTAPQGKWDLAYIYCGFNGCVGYHSTSAAGYAAKSTVNVPAGSTGLSIVVDFYPCASANGCSAIDTTAKVTVTINGVAKSLQGGVDAPARTTLTWSYAPLAAATPMPVVITVQSTAGSTGSNAWFGFDALQSTCN